MRCLVTGAAGFIGSWLVQQLLEDGHSVIAVVHRQKRAWAGDVRTVACDLNDLADLRTQLAGERIDVLFHLAWWGVGAESRNDAAQILNNVAASLQLWQLAVERECRHWIGLGSQAEYGPYDCRLREDLAPRPVTAYGVAKLASGMLTAKLAEMADMRHTSVRLVAAYGPGEDEGHLIPSVMRALLAGIKPSLTRGEQTCDYLYVEDAARALCAIAAAGATGILNLASGRTIELRTLVECIRGIIDPDLPLGLGEVAYRKDQVMHLEADLTRLRASTDWRPRVDLEEGLRRTVAWWRGEAQRCPAALLIS